MFESLAKSLIGSFPNLRNNLQSAGIYIKPEDYLKKVISLSLLATLGLGIALFLVLLKSENLVLMFMIIPLFAVVFFMLINRPKSTAKKRINEVDSEIVFAGRHILVEMSDGNLGKVVGILKKEGYRVKQPVDPMGIADERTRNDWIRHKHMKAFNFYKEAEFKEVDIIIESPVSFAEAKKSALRIKIDDTLLPVISIDNLIKMKRGTGRGVDKLDIEELKKIKKLKRDR